MTTPNYSDMNHDELVQAGQAWFAEVEARVQTAGKTRVLKLVKAAHNALNIGAAMLADDDQIQPLSGDDKD